MVMWTVTFAAFPTTSVSAGAREGATADGHFWRQRNATLVRLRQRDREQTSQQPD